MSTPVIMQDLSVEQRRARAAHELIAAEVAAAEPTWTHKTPVWNELGENCMNLYKKYVNSKDEERSPEMREAKSKVQNWYKQNPGNKSKEPVAVEEAPVPSKKKRDEENDGWLMCKRIAKCLRLGTETMNLYREGEKLRKENKKDQISTEMREARNKVRRLDYELNKNRPVKNKPTTKPAVETRVVVADPHKWNALDVLAAQYASDDEEEVKPWRPTPAPRRFK